MTVPYIFANQTGNIALSELDANFANVKAAADTAGTVTASAQPVITSVGQLTSLIVSGNIRTLSGGMYAPGYYWANGVSILSSIDSNNYGNSNVASYLPTYTGALTSLTGNVTTTASIIGANGIFSGPVTVSGNIQGGNIVTNGVINSSRTITGGNLTANGAVTGYTLEATVGGVTAFGNIVGGNITTTGNVVATQRVQGSAFLTAGAVQGSDLYSTGPVRGAYIVSSGNLSIATSASIGTNLSVTGDVTANAFIGSGTQLTGISGPSFSAIQTSPQVIPVAPTNLTLLFQNKELDSANCFNTSNGRFTPTVAGWYQINASVQVFPTDSLSNIAILIRLAKNGIVTKLGSYPGINGFQPISTLNCLIYLNGTTDYIYCDLFTTAALSVFATSGSGTSTYFQGHWLRS